MQHLHRPMPLDVFYREAWRTVKGTKFPSFVTLITLIITQVALYFISAFIIVYLGDSWIDNVVHLVLSAIFIVPLLTGFLMMGVKRFREPSLRWSEGLHYYHLIPSLAVAFFVGVVILWLMFMIVSAIAILLMMLLHVEFNFHYHLTAAIFISGMVISLIYGLYKSFFLFNFLLVADQKVNPLLAWWHSAKMLAPHWGKVFLTLIYMLLFNLLGICLLGIGLIWTIPWTYLVIGKMYLFCMHEQEHIHSAPDITTI